MVLPPFFRRTRSNAAIGRRPALLFHGVAEATEALPDQPLELLPGERADVLLRVAMATSQFAGRLMFAAGRMRA